MTEEHIFDRYQKAKNERERAQHRVDESVTQFRHAADLLQYWKAVGFTGKLADGTLVRPAAPGGDVINLQGIPSLETIRNAIEGWRKAETAVRGAVEAMTTEQRRTVGEA